MGKNDIMKTKLNIDDFSYFSYDCEIFRGKVLSIGTVTTSEKTKISYTFSYTDGEGYVEKISILESACFNTLSEAVIGLSKATINDALFNYLSLNHHSDDVSKYLKEELAKISITEVG